MNRFEFTPEKIEALEPNEVFVFGSNTEGRHGAGAAKVAMDKFGAVHGQAFGAQGQSFAIVTKDISGKKDKQIPLWDINQQICFLYGFAAAFRELTFYVTKIGTGLAGHSTERMAAVLREVEHLRPENVVLPKEFSSGQEA